ncbi:MAG: maleylpyruvate isomerase family mycothiol-dependent enzyme [Catenulispora sp.]
MTEHDDAPATVYVYRDAVLAEIGRMVALVEPLTPDRTSAASPCQGWSILDVARHVAVTPPLIGEAFDTTLPPRTTTTPRPLPSTAGHAEILDALTKGAAYVDRALSDPAHAGLDLATPVPGRLAPMPADLTLRLTFSELVLHRCDIELALDRAPTITDAHAVVVLDTLREWLFRLSRRAQPPTTPVGFELRDEHGRTWALHHTGEGWTEHRSPDSPAATVIRGRTDALALALAGRVGLDHPGLASVDRDAVVLLKRALPGP